MDQRNHSFPAPAWSRLAIIDNLPSPSGRGQRPYFTQLSYASSKLAPTGTGGVIHMSDLALPGSIEPALKRGPDLDRGFHPLTGVIYMGVVAAALLYVAYSIYTDIEATGTRTTTYAPFILLFVALL